MVKPKETLIQMTIDSLKRRGFGNNALETIKTSDFKSSMPAEAAKHLPNKIPNLKDIVDSIWEVLHPELKELEAKSGGGGGGSGGDDKKFVTIQQFNSLVDQVSSIQSQLFSILNTISQLEQRISRLENS